MNTKNEELTHYQEMPLIERQLLVGKIVDLLIYDATFCTNMIQVIKLKESLGEIKSTFLPEKLKVV